MGLARLFDIIHILSDERTVTAGALAGRLEVSERTIRRDIDRLCQAGMPVLMSQGRTGGISLMPGYVFDRTALTAEDRQSILSSLKAFDSLRREPEGGTAARMAAMFGQPAFDMSDWIEVDFTDWAAPDGERDLFGRLRGAILNRQCAAFDYSNARGISGARVVEPLKLGFRGHGWYLYAHCRDRDDARFFKLTRMRSLRVLDEHFTRPTPARIFDAGRPGPEECIRLALRIAPDKAYRVYDDFTDWEREPDGSFVVQFDCPLSDWLYGYVASFGSDCEVLSPDSFRESFARELERILALYRPSEKNVESGGNPDRR